MFMKVRAPIYKNTLNSAILYVYQHLEKYRQSKKSIFKVRIYEDSSDLKGRAIFWAKIENKWFIHLTIIFHWS